MMFFRNVTEQEGGTTVWNDLYLDLTVQLYVQCLRVIKALKRLLLREPERFVRFVMC